jgi:hypothetical protein
MKNRQFEKNIEKAKRFVKRWKMTHKLTKRGHYVPHSYTGVEKALSWWDDVFFPLGSQLVVVNWTHPRTRYKDAVEELAYEEANKREPQPDYNLFGEAEPVYEKVGNGNRKKIIAWRLPSAASNPALKWANEWRRIEEEMLPKSNIVIRPSFNVKQRPWGRVVDICMPIEVKSQADVEDLATYVRAVLTGVAAFESCYPDGYSYGCNDWVRDMECMNKKIDEVYHGVESS